MSFTSVQYLFFLAIVAGVFHIVPAKLRITVILAASYVFYFTWNVHAAALIAISTLFAYVAGIAIAGERDRKRQALTFAVAGLLVAYLFAFKVALLTPARGIGGLIMPLGISYYSFKLIGYVLDVYWEKMPAQRNPIAFAAFVAFFPQLVAGPIQRAESFFAQLPPARGRIASGASRIALGLAKKLLIADYLAPAVAYVYGHSGAVSAGPAWLAFYLFPLQLYADFSALTDIAIGSGRLFGIEGPENFNRPFTAENISDYWRRWHMSLTTWLGDYVFTPLRMATRNFGQYGLVFSLTINMIAIGLWHGLTWGYFWFGVAHAAFLCADALSARKRARFLKHHPHLNAPASWLGWLLTMHMVAFALVLFRAPDMGAATNVLRHLFTNLRNFVPDLAALASATGTRLLVLGLAGYAALEVAERFRPDLRWAAARETGPRWLRWSVTAVMLAVFTVGLLMLVARTATRGNPFLYEIF
jgi:D-alanyl-lipoteichoic acid acyltransferase DltB (MBOAT superfamily)